MDPMAEIRRRLLAGVAADEVCRWVAAEIRAAALGGAPGVAGPQRVRKGARLGSIERVLLDVQTTSGESEIS
jgi:hypothetical protein